MKCPRCNNNLRFIDDLDIYICSCKCYWTSKDLEEIEKYNYKKWCERVIINEKHRKR